MSTQPSPRRAGPHPGPATALIAIAALGLLIAALAGFETLRAPDGDQTPPSPSLAQVDGDQIPLEDVIAEAVRVGAVADGETLDPQSAAATRVLEELIDRKILARAARDLGYDSDEALRRRLRLAEERLLADEMLRRTVTAAVTDESIERRYRRQARLVRLGDEVRARHILLDTQPDAQEVRQAIEAGGEFTSIARARSLDRTTARTGGDLGWFVRGSVLAQIGDAAFAARPGDVVGPFPSPLGWHVLEVLDRRPERPQPLETMRAEIERVLTLEAVERVLDRLRAEADIRYTPPPAPPPSPEPTSEDERPSGDDSASDSP